MGLSQTFYISQTTILAVLLLSLIFMQIALKVLSAFEFYKYFISVLSPQCLHGLFYTELNQKAMQISQSYQCISVLFYTVHIHFIQMCVGSCIVFFYVDKWKRHALYQLLVRVCNSLS